MTKYNSIDVLKFVASFFVLIIHVSLFNDVNPYLNLFTAHGISRLAVPIYFLASAFFFYKKSINFTVDEQRVALIKYTKRMAILYIGWFIIFLPKTVFERFIINETSFLLDIIIFVKNFFLTSTFSGSWFLVSCVFCVWLLFFICKSAKENNEKVLVVISAICYLFCVISSAYGNIFEFIGLGNFYEAFVYYVAKPYTSILVGVPYFVIGRYFAKNDIKLTMTKKILGALSLILLFVEIFLTYKLNLQQTTDCFLMLLPSSCFLFLLIKNVNIELKFNPVYLRNASTIIFFSHFLFIFAIEIFEKVLSVEISTILRFCIVSILSLVLAYIFIRLSKCKKFSWLKYLY